MGTKYIVKKNDKVGRYCTAGCDLKIGETIFFEEPFSVGPKSGSPAVCLGCYKTLYDSITVCDKCSWPVCSSNCSKEELHSKNECEIFSKVGIKFDANGDPAAQLESITVLRTLLESERNPTTWTNEVLVMESHTEERKVRTELWAAEQANVVDFLHDRCQLNRFNKEIIQRVCGILEVNCFEIVIDEYASIRGLYPNLAILSHNCVANTTHSKIPGTNFKMVVRTTTEVKQGEELFSSYTKSTDPTLVRRMKLSATKYFNCDCKRCSDPTELGTHLNSLKCTKCDNGLVITANPLDNDAPWKCTHCDYGITGAGVQKVYTVIQNELEELELMPFGPERIECGERLLKQYKSVLHPNHAFKLALWHDLSQLYGRAEGYSLDMLPDLMLERKAEMCTNLLKAYDVIEPGYTRLRGLALYELHVSLLLLYRSQYEYKTINTEKFKEQMRKVADILEESGKILSIEPEGTQEAGIGASALQAVEQLRSSVELLKDPEPEQEEKDNKDENAKE